MVRSRAFTKSGTATLRESMGGMPTLPTYCFHPKSGVRRARSPTVILWYVLSGLRRATRSIDAFARAFSKTTTARACSAGFAPPSPSAFDSRVNMARM
jgi:hypothetical protein